MIEFLFKYFLFSWNFKLIIITIVLAIYLCFSVKSTDKTEKTIFWGVGLIIASSGFFLGITIFIGAFDIEKFINSLQNNPSQYEIPVYITGFLITAFFIAGIVKIFQSIGDGN